MVGNRVRTDKIPSSFDGPLGFLDPIHPSGPGIRGALGPTTDRGNSGGIGRTGHPATAEAAAGPNVRRGAVIQPGRATADDHDVTGRAVGSCSVASYANPWTGCSVDL